MLEEICYENSQSSTKIPLRYNYIGSNPRASKGFAFGGSDGVAVDSPKEFELSIVISSGLDDWIVDFLLYDVEHGAYGRLLVNGWTLRCRCTGITSVDEDEWGVRVFNARFYAPSFHWFFKLETRRPITDAINTPSGSGGSYLWIDGEYTGYRVTTASDAHTITVKRSSNGGAYSTLYTIHINNCPATGNLEIDPITKKIYIGTTDVSGYIPYTEEIFPRIDKVGTTSDSIKVVLSNTFTGDRGYWGIAERRGMPKWN